MAKHKLKHQTAADVKALKVAQYIKFYKSVMGGNAPTLEKIAEYFRKSISWAKTYRKEILLKSKVHYTVHCKSEQLVKGTCFATPPNPQGLIKWLAGQDWPEWTYASWHMEDRSGMIWRNPTGPGIVTPGGRSNP